MVPFHGIPKLPTDMKQNGNVFMLYIASCTTEVCFHCAIFFVTPIHAMEKHFQCVTSNVQYKHASVVIFFLIAM